MKRTIFFFPLQYFFLENPPDREVWQATVHRVARSWIWPKWPHVHRYFSSLWKLYPSECNLKNDRVISVHFQGKPFNITEIEVYAPTTNAEEAEVERFYYVLQYLLELTPKKKGPFHHRGVECKSRKSRDSWSNRQVWPWSTNRSRAKVNRILPREHTGHSKHPLPATQEMTLHVDITK